MRELRLQLPIQLVLLLVVVVVACVPRAQAGAGAWQQALRTVKQAPLGTRGYGGDGSVPTMAYDSPIWWAGSELGAFNDSFNVLDPAFWSVYVQKVRLTMPGDLCVHPGPCAFEFSLPEEYLGVYTLQELVTLDGGVLLSGETQSFLGTSDNKFGVNGSEVDLREDVYCYGLGLNYGGYGDTTEVQAPLRAFARIGLMMHTTFPCSAEPRAAEGVGLRTLGDQYEWTQLASGRVTGGNLTATDTVVESKFVAATVDVFGTSTPVKDLERDVLNSFILVDDANFATFDLGSNFVDSDGSIPGDLAAFTYVFDMLLKRPPASDLLVLRYGDTTATKLPQISIRAENPAAATDAVGAGGDASDAEHLNSGRALSITVAYRTGANALITDAVSPAARITVGRWHQIALLADTYSYAIYLDGTPIWSQLFDGTRETSANAQFLYVTQPGEASSTVIHDLRFYELRLPTSAIAGLFQTLRSRTETCGNGVRDPPEDCDDGNRVDGDGCSAACAVEASSVCVHGTNETKAGPDMCKGGQLVPGARRDFTSNVTNNAVVRQKLDFAATDPASWTSHWTSRDMFGILSLSTVTPGGCAGTPLISDATIMGRKSATELTSLTFVDHNISTLGGGPHDAVHVEFDVAFFDNWIGEDFVVQLVTTGVDPPANRTSTLLRMRKHETTRVVNSIVAEGSDLSTYCLPFSGDLAHVSLEFPHNASSIKLRFTTNIDEGRTLGDLSWSLGHVNISYLHYETSLAGAGGPDGNLSFLPHVVHGLSAATRRAPVNRKNDSSVSALDGALELSVDSTSAVDIDVPAPRAHAQVLDNVLVDRGSLLQLWLYVDRMPQQRGGFDIVILDLDDWIAAGFHEGEPFVSDELYNREGNPSVGQSPHFYRICVLSSDEPLDYDSAGDDTETAYDNDAYCDERHAPSTHRWHHLETAIVDKFVQKYAGATHPASSDAVPSSVRVQVSLRAEGTGRDRQAKVLVDDVQVVQQADFKDGDACPALRVQANYSGGTIDVAGSPVVRMVAPWNLVVLDARTHSIVRTLTGLSEAYFVGNITGLDDNQVVLIGAIGPTSIPCDSVCQVRLTALGAGTMNLTTRAFAMIGMTNAGAGMMPTSAAPFGDRQNAVVADMVGCHGVDVRMPENAGYQSPAGGQLQQGAWEYSLSQRTHGYEGCFRYDSSAFEALCYKDSVVHSPLRCSLCCLNAGMPFAKLVDPDSCYCALEVGESECDNDNDCGVPQLSDMECGAACTGDPRQRCGSDERPAYSAYRSSGYESLTFSVACDNEFTPCTNAIDRNLATQWLQVTAPAGTLRTMDITLANPDAYRVTALALRLVPGQLPSKVFLTVGAAYNYTARDVSGNLGPGTTLVLPGPDLITNETLRVQFVVQTSASPVYEAFVLGVPQDKPSVPFPQLLESKISDAELQTAYVVKERASPSHFLISDLLGVDNRTGTLKVNHLLPQRHIQPHFVTVRHATEDNFESSIYMNSSMPTTTFVELHHGIRDLPLSVSVQVLPEDAGSNLAGFVFAGIGNVFTNGDEPTNDNFDEPYTGVIYGFNETHIRLWAPSSTETGALAGVTGGWGGPFDEISRGGTVNVRVNRGRAPNFDSGWFNMSTDTNAQADVLHNSMTDITEASISVVKVLYRVRSGPNAGFVFEAGSTTMTNGDSGEYGGPIFAYNEDLVRVWLPNDTNIVRRCAVPSEQEMWPGSCVPCKWQCGNATRGYAFLLPPSFGNGMYAQTAQAVDVRVLTWVPEGVHAQPDYVSDWEAISALGLAYLTDTHGLSAVPAIARGLVRTNESGEPLLFNAFGAVQGSDTLRKRKYGGHILGVSDSEWRVWAPAASQGQAQSYQQLVTLEGWGEQGNVAFEGLLGRLRVVLFGTDPTLLRDSVRSNVTVADVNDAPESTSAAISVVETAKDGKVVLTLSPSDKEEGAGGPFSFEIVSGDFDGIFAVNSSGEIYIRDRTLLDFETTTSYFLTVRVTDGGGSSLDVFVTVTVADENEPGQIFPPFSRNVSENGIENDIVGDPLNASDPDVGQAPLFTLLPLGNHGTFFISRCEGQLRLRKPERVDHENVTGFSSFDLNILLTDDGVDPPNITQAIQVYIDNGNDAPYWTTTPTIFVSEDTPSGAVISPNLTNFCLDLDPHDDLDFNILYIVGDDGSTSTKFSVNGNTGEVRVEGARLNFEGAVSTYVLRVRCSDSLSPIYGVQDIPLLSASEDVFVTVLDANDAPVFQNTPIELTLPENSVNGTLLDGPNNGQISVLDEDVGDIVDIEVADDAGGLVRLVHVSPGIVQLAATGMPLDQETTPVFQVVLNATDRGILTNGTVPAKFTLVNISVQVIDVNEEPTILGQTYTVEEDTAVGTVLGWVNASDPDVGDVASFSSVSLLVRFRSVGPLLADEIILDAPLDFEAESNESFVVRVEDKFALEDTARHFINVTDRNDAPFLVCGGGAVCQDFFIREDATTGLLIGNVNVSDQDNDPLTVVFSSPSATIANRFELNSTSGDLFVNLQNSAKLNFEATNKYTQNVRVQDTTTKPPGSLSSIDVIRINLLDVDEPPEPTSLTDLKTASNLTASTNQFAGDPVGVTFGAFMTDPEGGQLNFSVPANATLTGTVPRRSARNPFNISQDTGQLFIADLDALADAQRWIVPIVVNDTSDTAYIFNVYITVTNDNTPPVFDQPSYACSVVENADPGTPVCNFSATDPQNISSYFFSVGAPQFSLAAYGPVDARRVQILTTTTKINFELLPPAFTYALAVGAIDNHKDPLVSIAPLTITPLDGNDPPVAVNATVSGSILENSPAGTSVGPIFAATDEDGDFVNFTVAGAERFTFESRSQGRDTGQLYVRDNATLDFETSPTFTVDVDYVDSGGANGSIPLQVVVSLTDVDEGPSPFVQHVGTVKEGILSASVLNTTGGVFFRVDDPERDAYFCTELGGANPFAASSTADNCLLQLAGISVDFEDITSLAGNVFVEQVSDITLNGILAFNVTVENLNDVTVTDVSTPAPGNVLSPLGGDLIVVTGTDFGRIAVSSEVRVQYGPTGNEYEATLCNVTKPGNTQIECFAAPGQGQRMIWNVTVVEFGHSATLAGTNTIGYARPLVSSFVVDAPVRTQGGDDFLVHGFEFGNMAQGSDYVYQGQAAMTFDPPGPNTYVLSDPTVTTPGDTQFCRGGTAFLRTQPNDIVRLACDPTSLPCRLSTGVRYLSFRVLSLETEPDLSNTTGSCSVQLLSWGNMRNTLGVSVQTSPFAVAARRISVQALNPADVPVDFDLQDWWLLAPAKPTIFITAALVDDFDFSYTHGLSFVRDCAWWNDTYANCSTPSGVGSGYAAQLYVGGQASDMVDGQLSYEPPAVTDLRDASSPFFWTPMDTRGARNIHVAGVYFTGVNAEFENEGAGVVRYGPGGSGFTAASCSEVPELSRPGWVPPHIQLGGKLVKTNVLLCVSVEGTGKGHTWTVEVGGQTSPTSTNVTSYQPPIISSMADRDWPFPSTQGGSTVTLIGDYFGPAGSSPGRTIDAVYGRPSQFVSRLLFRAQSSSCSVTVDHVEMECLTGEGTGVDLGWQLNVTAQTSNRYLANSSYNAPILGSFAVNESQPSRFPDDAEAFDTAGGEYVLVNGFNFGPQPAAVGSPPIFEAEIDATVLWTDSEEVRYRFDYGVCNVTVPHTQLRCAVSPGAGSGLEWTIRVDNQTNTDASTSYGAPEVRNVTGDGFALSGGLNTTGEQWIIISGFNYGGDISLLDYIGYGPTGVEYTLHDGETVNRCQNLTHSSVRCRTRKGVGANLLVLMIVGGQQSVTHSSTAFAYKAPIVSSVSITNGTTRGGYTATVLGENFGPREKFTLVMGGVTMTNIVYLTDGNVEFDVPTGEGSHDIAVQHVSGKCTVANSCFQTSALTTFTYLPPQVDRFVVSAIPDNNVDVLVSFFGVFNPTNPNQDGGSFGTGVVKGDNTGVEFTWTTNLGAPTVYTNEILIFKDANDSFSAIPPATFCNMGNGSWGHDKVECVVNRRNGTAVMYVGPQRSEEYTFSDFSPSVRTIKALNTTTLPTSGGFELKLRGEFFGTLESELKILLRLEHKGVRYMDDVDCPLVPGSLKLVNAGTATSIVRCTVPPGSGANVTVIVKKGSGEQTSAFTNGTNCFPCFSYDPPQVSRAYAAAVDSRRLQLSAISTVAATDAAFADVAVEARQAAQARAVRRLMGTIGNFAFVSGTEGASNLTIYGVNLGQAASFIMRVSSDIFGSTTVDATTLGAGHGSASVRLPAGVTPKHLFVEVANQRATPRERWFNMSYESPLVMQYRAGGAVSGVLDTVGGELVTIVGTDFGEPRAGFVFPNATVELEDAGDVAYGSVNLQVSGTDTRAELVQFWNHTHIVFASPEGIGTALPLVVTTDGGTSSISTPAYNPPVISSLTPPTGTTAGGTRMLLRGTGFGTADFGSTRFILFNGISIPSSEWISNNDSAIVFDSPQNQGANVTVNVTIGGQISANVLFSYAPPRLDSLSRVSGPTEGCDQYVTTDEYFTTLASDSFAVVRECYDKAEMVLRGESMGTHSMRIEVVRSADGERFVCETDSTGALVTVENATVWDCLDCADTLNGQDNGACYQDDNEIVLRTPTGIGTNLTLQLFVEGRRDQASVTANYTFDAPVIDEVNPRPYDARGGSLTVRGLNFGSSRTNTTLVIVRPSGAALECPAPVWNAADVPGNGLPYVTCETREDVAGYKGANMSVAQQLAVHRIEYDSEGEPGTNNLFKALCGEEFTQEDGRVTYYGLPFYEEFCVECPEGAVCELDQEFKDPVSAPGFYRVYLNVNSGRARSRCPSERREPDESMRTECPDFLACRPTEACLGGNECEVGYQYLQLECEDKLGINNGTEAILCEKDSDCTGGKDCDSKTPQGCAFCDIPDVTATEGQCVCGASERCALCTVFEYYQYNDECIPCPNNVIVIIVLFVFALIMFTVAGYILNRKKFNMAFLSIGFDYFQVLAVFASADVPWPAVIDQFFRFIAFFSFDIDITAPECAIPNFTYEKKWAISVCFPLMAAGLFLFMHVIYVFKRLLNNERGWKHVNSHYTTLVAMFVVMLYYLYLPLTRRVLEVFNCSPADPPDGFTYTEWTSTSCGGGLCKCWVSGSPQMDLFPFAVLFFLIYSLGFPVFAAFVILSKKKKLKEDQLLRAMGLGDSPATNPDCYDIRAKYHKLYYHFKPGKVYWILLILARKFWIALAALMFQESPSFQLAFILLILFTGFVLQVRHRPFMSNAEQDLEVRKHKIKIQEARAQVEAGALEPEQHLAMHVRIEEHLQTVQRQQEFKDKRQRRAGSIGEVAGDQRPDSREYFWDYNTVEVYLLASAIFVCVCGVMFDSKDENSTDELKAYFEFIGVLCLLTIICSLIYYGVVFISEVLTAFGYDEGLLWLRKFFQDELLHTEQLDTELVMTDVATVMAQTRGAKRAAYEANFTEKDEVELQKLVASVTNENQALFREITVAKRENTALMQRAKQTKVTAKKGKKKIVGGQSDGMPV